MKRTIVVLMIMIGFQGVRHQVRAECMKYWMHNNGLGA